MMLCPFLLSALIPQKNLYPISGQRDDEAIESFTIPTEAGEERLEEEDKKVAEVNENDFSDLIVRVRLSCLIIYG